MLVASIDVGGTFTDLVIYDSETRKLAVTKVPSTANQAEGVLEGLRALDVAPRALGLLVHGTTVATNAILQRRGVKVALITTKGFRDVLEVGQTRRRVPNTMFDRTFRRPDPLVARPLRFEVAERMRHTGEVLTKISTGDLEHIAGRLASEEVEAVAVCLLHAYANDAHEAEVAVVLGRMLPGLFVTRSAEVVAEHREFERFSTTVVNAYVSPVLARYLTTLSSSLAEHEFRRPLYTMSSSGGTMSVDQASRLGVKTILSGPVGGVQAAVFLGAAAGTPDVISYDMGGTSTDVALIHNLTPALSTDNFIASYPIRTPQVDINTVGAGGGSIARLDSAGALVVGPESAGAIPGPACYGRGGSEPTVTDANLVLGRLSPHRPLAGTVWLDAGLAKRALERLATQMGNIEILPLAEGIVKLAVARMASATRAISVQRGHDPRDFTLMAFGGAGPMHACALAGELGVRRVLVPPSPGNVSALGLLTSDVRHDLVHTRLALIRSLDAGEVGRMFRELERRASGELKNEGFLGRRARFEYSLDLRYAGQAWEVNVPVPGEGLEAADLRAAFDEQYERIYGHRGTSEEEVQLVRLRLSAFGVIDKPSLSPLALHATGATSAKRDVYFSGQWHSCPVYEREGLGVQAQLAGPLIVEEFGSTTVVEPGWLLRVDKYGNLMLETAEESPQDMRPGR